MSILGYVTCKNISEAREISTLLLKKRLIACSNIISRMESHYRWKGKIVNERECLLLLKTTKKNTDKVIKETKKIHSDSIPCIEFIEIFKGNKEYEKWLRKEIK